MKTSNFSALIQRFFTDRLCTQMEASRHTIAGYRDTFRLLIQYASARYGKPPTKLTIEDLDADLIADFLAHVETARGNTARTRNTRLAAIRSFFRYVALTDPSWLLHCQRILSMPNKRYVKRSVTFLDADEIAALLAAPDRTKWAGRRDHVLLVLALQTGLRASELVNLRCKDVVLGTGAHIRCIGKGRKERSTPLRRDTAKLIQTWIGERRDSDGPLFPSIRGERLSRDALEQAAAAIRGDYPGLAVSPLAGDFTAMLSLPPDTHGRPRIGFFPGSTIGNFAPDAAVAFLQRVRRLLGDGSQCLVGADLVKDEATLLSAYDDAGGVTAAFNRNVLARINRELGGDFDLDAFEHRAVWNAAASRMEMWLVSTREQTVHVLGRAFHFAAGEGLHTENSHKFTPASFTAVAERAGWKVARHWISPEPRFAMFLLSAA